jgi:MFS family permease
MDEKQLSSAGTDAVPGNSVKPRRLWDRIGADRDFNLFLIMGVFSGIAGGINSTIFNNYLSDVYKLSADARGIVEFPREMPGVLIMVVLGLLAFLGDIRIAMVGLLGASLGMLGLGMFSPTFAIMMIWMMIYSLGTHMVMPVTPVIGMSLSGKESYGSRLGRYSAYGLFGTLFAYAFVWAGFRYFGLTYRVSFIIAAVFYVLAALSSGLMKANKPEKRKIRFVFRKRYSLYYILCIVNGARKQIFMTFAPWVLIQVFHLDAPVFAILGVIVALVSIMTRTIVGKTIDIKGERFILSLEAILLLIICIGYAFAADFFSAGVAVVIIAGCYIIDNSMNAVEMARSTYVRKIAVDPDDVTPTLSAGTSIDHVVSMSIPVFGGMLWAAVGYKYVFIAAAGIALLNLFLSRKIET